MDKPEPKKYLKNIAPYKGGVSNVEGIDNIYKLSSNENSLGPSEFALKKYQEESNNLSLYPDSGNRELIDSISKNYSLERNRIICGCGSDELLHLLARTYLNEDDEGLISENAFAVYPLAILNSGANVVRAKENALQPNIEDLISNINEKTKIIFIANPNNPTGSLIKRDDLKKLYSAIPSNVLLVIDAAYSEYVTDPNYEIGFDLAKENNNIVITKTFSKAFGLAGLRVGWAYCPDDIAKTLLNIKVPFSVNVAAQKTAIAALEDNKHIQLSIDHNSKWLRILEDEFAKYEKRGIKIYPSQCNFVLIEFTLESKIKASDAYNQLCSKGLITREMQEYNLDNFLRITIGNEEANLLLIESFKELMI